MPLKCVHKGCGKDFEDPDEPCHYHPGPPVFHEGHKETLSIPEYITEHVGTNYSFPASPGWKCCKPRVLNFDEFLEIAPCTVGKHSTVDDTPAAEPQRAGIETEEITEGAVLKTAPISQTRPSHPPVTLGATGVYFSSPNTIEFDLPTTDNKRFRDTYELFAPIDTGKSQYKIMGTKMELTLVKADGSSWPVLRSDDRRTGEIIQTGRATKA
ncbi:hypothetical protein CISG_07392 [Coccidioides immitis RMSCC 3703]|uniref:CORD and CS domain containing protein n=1 Tax=Coccidioides immitis RMSCC 3703 TaxID=454286 RepID=A0A0J8R3C9_COCIT|nr:hypothetical protein CISG_07392 [Coccidioides immitis RMSCC 3703]